MLVVIAPREKWICVTGADAMNIDSFQPRSLRFFSPRAAKQIDPMAAGDDTAENFL
jgi:hypothetical protein